MQGIKFGLRRISAAFVFCFQSGGKAPQSKSANRPKMVCRAAPKGGLLGGILVSSTFVVNIKTGEGILFGSIDWKDPNSDGGFRGPFFGTVSGAFAPGLGGFDGQWSLHGYGSHLGETAHIDNYGPFSLPQDYQGVIRVPG